MKIKLLKLYRHPRYLPPDEVRDRTLSYGDLTQHISKWWTNANKELRDAVLSDREEDGYIEAVAIIVGKTDGATIFSHEYNERWDKHTNPQVIADKDIISITDLHFSKEEPVAGDMVVSYWVDASHNNSPATIEDVKPSKGVMDITQLGFLMDANDERVFIGGRYNPEYKKYRYLGAVPTMNISSTKKLVL